MAVPVMKGRKWYSLIDLRPFITGTSTDTFTCIKHFTALISNIGYVQMLSSNISNDWRSEQVQKLDLPRSYTTRSKTKNNNKVKAVHAKPRLSQVNVRQNLLATGRNFCDYLSQCQVTFVKFCSIFNDVTGIN